MSKGKKIEITREYQQLVYKVEYSIDWVVEISFTKFEREIEFWIYRKDIGIKSLMFAIENTNQSFESLMYLLESNVRDYINSYYNLYVR